MATATRTVREIEKEIYKLEDARAELQLRLGKIQSKCGHKDTEKLSPTLKCCNRCHKEIYISPTTSMLPPSAFQ